MLEMAAAARSMQKQAYHDGYRARAFARMAAYDSITKTYQLMAASSANSAQTYLTRLLELQGTI